MQQFPSALEMFMQQKQNSAAAMQQWGNDTQPKSTTEQLLPVVQSGEYNAPYTPATGVENFLNFAQNTENVVGGTYEANLVREGIKKFGPSALKQIAISPAKVLGGMAIDWALPNRVNDMDEVKAIQNTNQVPAAYNIMNMSDYDTNGYVAKYGQPDQSKGQHLTDEFKLPNHTTFSDQSKYSSKETPGGHWAKAKDGKWEFAPTQYNLDNVGGLNNLKAVFDKNETDKKTGQRNSYIVLNGKRH